MKPWIRRKIKQFILSRVQNELGCIRRDMESLSRNIQDTENRLKNQERSRSSWAERIQELEKFQRQSVCPHPINMIEFYGPSRIAPYTAQKPYRSICTHCRHQVHYPDEASWLKARGENTQARKDALEEKELKK